MELNPFESERRMSNAHNALVFALLVVAPTADLKTLWQGVRIDHQRMVAGHRQRIFQGLEYPLAVMCNRRGFAVYDARGSDDLGPIGRRHGLMS